MGGMSSICILHTAKGTAGSGDFHQSILLCVAPVHGLVLRAFEVEQYIQVPVFLDVWCQFYPVPTRSSSAHIADTLEIKS